MHIQQHVTTNPHLVLVQSGRIETLDLPVEETAESTPWDQLTPPQGGQFGQQWDEQQYGSAQPAYQYGSDAYAQVRGRHISKYLSFCTRGKSAERTAVVFSLCMSIASSSCFQPMHEHCFELGVKLLGCRKTIQLNCACSTTQQINS